MGGGLSQDERLLIYRCKYLGLPIDRVSVGQYMTERQQTEWHDKNCSGVLGQIEV